MLIQNIWDMANQSIRIKIHHTGLVKSRGDANVIAEIKGKLNQTGYNLNDRLEDNLTGNFFGTLRYIPFDLALRKILSGGVYPSETGDKIGGISADFWGDKIEFWPYDTEGEIDALLHFDDTIIGIEVKYASGLSSDDDIDNSAKIDEQSIEEQSRNQLSRESRIVSRHGAGKTKILLFIANSDSCRTVYDDVLNRKIISNDVTLAYISWQSILVELEKLKLDNRYYQVIIDDLISLLKKKGFESFKDMNVQFDVDIDQTSFYSFGATDSLDFNIKMDSTIEGDLHYEFS
ncbi:hypothetical protein [Trichococcus palustris]|uniref:hypothetical protein n=1 Tax=Trichococcus palustris TaxID=140314 RepID=UPI000B352A59|nr:hypothetical protein [Trichococcus palustris]